MKKFSPFLFLIFTINLLSQEEANFWYFGENVGLNFNTNPPTALTGSLSTDEGSASISDNNGFLQFYSDGSTVYSRNGAIMPNGTDLLGDSSSAQSAIIVPKPEDTNIYYLFTVGNQRRVGGNGVHYSEIDMRLNGGLGDVLIKNIPLNGSGNAREKITSVIATDCNTFWVITADNSNFYTYKINNTGVSTSPTLPNVTHTYLGNLRGYLKLSPNGKVLVNASANSGSYIYDFDPLTGEISNERTLSVVGDGYGVEFSRDSKQLYITTGTFSQINGNSRNPSNLATIQKFNLDSNQDNVIDAVSIINSSKKTIYSTNTGYRGALQLAGDGKIYYARSRETFLGVINNPENPGSNVNFVAQGLSLNGKICTEGLPPFIQSFFKSAALTDIDEGIKITGKLLVCKGELKRLGINNILDFDDTADISRPISYEWFRDNNLLPSLTSSIITVGGPTRDTSGVYTLKATYFNNCGRERALEAVATIVFGNKPTINNIDIYEQCDFDSNPNDFITNFNLTTKESKLYTETENVSIEFFETSDTSFSSPLLKDNYRNSIATSIINGSHKIIVKITNDDTGCYQTKEIELNVNPSGVSSYPDVYTCELDSNAINPDSRNSNGSGNSFFDFDQKTQEIISNSGGALTLATHNFSYFRTREDAGLQNNEITVPYEDHLFNDGDDIFVRISLSNSDSCESIGQFKIRIQEIPIPQGNTDTVILCTNNPVDNPQLITIDLDADTGINTDSYKWYLNDELIIGETNAILKANKEGTYKVEAIREYLNEPSDSSDDFTCIGYNTFTVLESNIAKIESIEFKDDQDLPGDNTLTVTVSGNGNYEYAINTNLISEFNKGDENLSYTFTEVQPGLNRVYIRDVNECGEVFSQEVSFIYFQRHFTPNEDGTFDTWKVLGTDNSYYNEVNIKIFDRFGKLLKVVDQRTENGWDGFLNGRLLPSNDYWYNAILIDRNGRSRIKTGHFSLIR